MNEKELILTKGEQPVATISEEELDFLIGREFPNDKEEVKAKLDKIISTSQIGKNRFSAAVLKLADRDFWYSCRMFHHSHRPIPHSHTRYTPQTDGVCGL